MKRRDSTGRFTDEIMYFVGELLSALAEIILSALFEAFAALLTAVFRL